jgi:MmpS family membrane protein
MPAVKGIPIFKVLSRTWIPLVILAVVVVGGFIVYRVHGYFGSEKRPSYADSNLKNPDPFNPKRIVYEVFGPAGTTADISYFDVNADPQRVDGAQLPWSLHISTTKAAVMGNLVAQGDSDSIGCRITVDDVVKAERVANEVNAYTFCVVKSA